MEEKQEANIVNKIIVVTGGSRGIGAEIVKHLSRLGYTVILNYNKSETCAKNVENKLKKQGFTVDIFKADVSKKEEAENLIKYVLNKYGKMRLKYLKEYRKADYTIMLINGTLNTHLKEIQETAQTRVEQIIDQLKEKSNLTEDMKNTDVLYWVGTMNSIKSQAEEIVLNELIYV